MKVNQKVSILHDGKRSRRCAGVVIATRNGHHVQVMFTEGPDEGHSFWARRRPKISYKKDVQLESCILVLGKRAPGSYAGWARTVDMSFPWFTVVRA